MVLKLKKGKIYFISKFSSDSENFELGIKKIYRLKTEDEEDEGEDKDESKYHFLEIITEGNLKQKGETLHIPKRGGVDAGEGRGICYPYLIEPADRFYLTNSAREKTGKKTGKTGKTVKAKEPTMKGGKRRRTKKNKTTKRRKTHRRR